MKMRACRPRCRPDGLGMQAVCLYVNGPFAIRMKLGLDFRLNTPELRRHPPVHQIPVVIEEKTPEL